MDRSSFTLRVKKCIQANAASNESVKMYSIFPYSTMSTIETIVRELEKIPEPIQLNVLDFIRSLGSISTATNSTGAETEVSHNQHPAEKRRTTSSLIAGKGRTLGDIVSSIVDKQD